MRNLMFYIITFITFFSCNVKKSDKPVITVTILPQQYFAQKIAGDKFDVNVMVPKGSSPESFDPAPYQLVDLTNSTAYFRIGGIGFEMAWMDKLAANSPHMVIFDNSQGITFLESEHDCSSHRAAPAQHVHSDQCNHTQDYSGDPHIWTSPRNAKIIAENMLEALVMLDAENKDYYENNYEELIKEIKSVDDSIQTILSKSDVKSFVIYHPSLTYFAHDYGLNQISIEGLGKESSAMRLKNLVDSVKSVGAKVFFIQKEFDTKNAEILAREVNGRIVPIDPLSKEWGSALLKIANELK